MSDKNVEIFARILSFTSITLFLIEVKFGKNPTSCSFVGNIFKKLFIFVVTVSNNPFPASIIVSKDGRVNSPVNQFHILFVRLVKSPPIPPTETSSPAFVVSSSLNPNNPLNHPHTPFINPSNIV